MIKLDSDISERSRSGVCVARIPDIYHYGAVKVGDRVLLSGPGGEAEGTVTEMNRIAWVARVRLDEGADG